MSEPNAGPGATRARDWSFARRPRWIVGHVLVVVVVVAFVNLGLWQLRRLQQRLDRNDVIEARLAAPAEPLADLLTRFDPSGPVDDPSSLAYRHAEVDGRFDAAREVLLRSRSRDGDAGYEVLTPLVIVGGALDAHAVLVDRGWVPYGDDAPPIDDAPPPAGPVHLVGLVRAPERSPTGGLAVLAPRDPAEGPLTTPYYADPRRLAPQMPYPLVDAALDLQRVTPPQPQRLPLPPLPPELSQGPHLSYAIQWFSFTLIALVGYTALMLRMSRGAEADPAAR